MERRRALLYQFSPRLQKGAASNLHIADDVKMLSYRNNNNNNKGATNNRKIETKS